MRIGFIVITIAVNLFLNIAECYSQDYTQTQNKIKAIYAYNFMKDVNLSSFRNDGDISICLMVKNGFYEELEKRIKDKLVGGRNAKINLISDLSECVNCDMIFVDEELGGNNLKRDDNCKSFIVTVGFFDKGLSSIALVYINKKLQFGVNSALCEKLGHKVASQLLTLANQAIVSSK